MIYNLDTFRSVGLSKCILCIVPDLRNHGAIYKGASKMILTLEITFILFQDYIRIIRFPEHWRISLAILMKFTHISIMLCLGINQNLLFPEIKNIEQNDIEKSRRKNPNFQQFRTINIRLNLRMNHPPNYLGMVSHKMSTMTIFGHEDFM